MKRFGLLLLFLLTFGFNSFAQKMSGIGGELSIISFKPNARLWLSKTTGFEVFGGIAASEDEFEPNDFEAGLKYLQTILYKRTERTYIGVVGKWKWVNNDLPSYTTNLPVAGILIGREWFSKRMKRKSFAIELGYQYGEKRFTDLNYELNIEPTIVTEFPFILNFRYSFYQIWR